MRKINFKSLLFHLFVPLMLSFIISMLIGDYSSYYNSIVKPVTVPSIVFPIVWTILYTLMGISYGILESNSLVDEEINSIYYGQLFVNALWSIFFFVLKWRLFAFLWILLLLALVIVMIIRFLDNHDMLPKSLTDGSIYHSTVLLSNLGSIHCDGTYL